MEKPAQNGDSDQDFDPSAEMLVNDFDDEHTLEEEEAMESGESVGNELDELQKEGEMPLDDLLAMYGLANTPNDTMTNPSPTVSKKESTAEKPTPPPPPTPPTVSSPPPPPIQIQPEPEPETPPPEVTVTVKPVIETPVPPPPVKEAPVIVQTEEKVIPPPAPPNPNPNPKPVEKPVTPRVENVSTTRHLLRACKSVSQPSESSGSDSDDDGSPDDDWRKTIQVGSDYQAQIPEGLCKYDGAPAYENEDRLLWDPVKLGDDEVEEYLRQAQMPHSSSSSSGPGGVHALPNGSHIRDDEQALYLLLQCGHNVEEALRRRRMQPTHPTDTMSLWSEEECRSFENGLRTYGKDFHLIQHHKVRTRAVGELVQFYYLWKKTERHDVFASKTRLEKKKYALHPGTTDYMDRFLDEQENPTLPRDRSSSPNTQSLLYGDGGRKQVTSSTNPRPGSTSSPPNSSNLTQSTAGITTKNIHQSPNLPTNPSLTRSPNAETKNNNNHVRETVGVLNGVDSKITTPPSSRSNRNYQQQNNINPLAALVQNSSPHQQKDATAAAASLRDYTSNNSVNEPYSSSSSLQDSTVSSGN